MSSKRSKVANACQRCRRQKLKCDVSKPCTLCVRAGVECITTLNSVWKPSNPASLSANAINGIAQDHPRPAKRVRNNLPSDKAELQPEIPSNEINGTLNVTTSRSNEQDGPLTGEAQGISSSATALVEEAFRCHEPDNTEASDIAGSHPLRRQPLHGFDYHHSDEHVRTDLPIQQDLFRQRKASQRLSHSAKAELGSCLPSIEAARLLVDTYFDRVHWFTLLFHQDDFRTRFQGLYVDMNSRLDSGDLGFVSTVLTVCAIGLQYLGKHREVLLLNLNVEAKALKQKVLTTLERNLLAIVSIASIETVQICVLLGTYYLYHGEPDLAWPVCGCGLRIAQALGLHRRIDRHPEQTQEQYKHSYEARKRCWWAVYEIETYCSMLYGLPLNITDADCSVEPLDASAKTTIGEVSRPSLLAYKYYTSKLSAIVKAVLVDLYGLRSMRGIRGSDTSGQAPYLKHVIKTIKRLDEKLRLWKSELPQHFQIMDNMYQKQSVYSEKELDETIGASGPRFERHILQLQIFSLSLAYQNARILVHRPLLSWRGVKSLSDDQAEVLFPRKVDPRLYSVEQCRDAALHISGIGTLPIFRQALRTYAATYIGTTLFTAGVTLGITASLNPLSQESHNSKLGLQRLIRLQACLESRSSMTDQTSLVLKRLAELVMKKELGQMVEPLQDLEPSPSAQWEHILHDNNQNLNKVQEDPNVPQRDSAHTPGGVCEATMSEAQAEDYDEHTPTISFNDVDFQCFEDPEILQSLFNFDQATPYPVYDQSEYDNGISSLQAQPFIEPTLFDQEQGWIWGLNSFSDQS